ncbi:MAG: hypothetical protein ACR2PR_06405, partial [Pseudohongiellaceae bacterium]
MDTQKTRHYRALATGLLALACFAGSFAATQAQAQEVYLVADTIESVAEGDPGPNEEAVNVTNLRFQILGGSATLGSEGGSPPIGTEIRLRYEQDRVPRVGELLRGDVGCLFSAPETVEFTSATGITVEITPAHDDVYRGDCTI